MRQCIRVRARVRIRVRVRVGHRSFFLDIGPWSTGWAGKTDLMHRPKLKPQEWCYATSNGVVRRPASRGRGLVHMYIYIYASTTTRRGAANDAIRRGIAPLLGFELVTIHQVRLPCPSSRPSPNIKEERAMCWWRVGRRRVPPCTRQSPTRHASPRRVILP